MLPANLLAVAQIWSPNAQQHLMLTWHQSLHYYASFSKSEDAVCQEIKKWKQIELSDQEGGRKTDRGLKERLKLGWRGMQVQQEALQILVATETNH